MPRVAEAAGVGGVDILDDVGDVFFLPQDGVGLLGASVGADVPGEAQPAEPEMDVNRAGPLARKMWNCARRGVRSPEVWSRFSQRVLATSVFMGAGDVALMFFAYARIKYRDLKVLDTISPFLLQHIDEFSTMELVLLFNAHKKLEFERTDSIKLLLTAICRRRDEWTGRHMALTANAAAYFYVYHPQFWKSLAVKLPKVVFTMNALEISNLVSAMARVDQRDRRSLLLLARMCRRCAVRNLFSQAALATAMKAFAKLDFNHPRLAKAFEDAAVRKLDAALELGPKYRASDLRDAEVFDLQALVQILHTLVCFVGTSDEVVAKLLTLISWSQREVSNYQRRVLRTVLIVLRKDYPHLYPKLDFDVKQALYIFEHTPAEVATTESRWSRELRNILKKMDVIVESKSLVDDQVLDIYIPSSKAVVCALGPYSYYASTTHRTAFSKLHQRLLEHSGYQCMVVPYYEWSEMKVDEDKMVYLWSLGRRAAAPDAERDAGAAEPSVEDLRLSDISDLDSAGAEQAMALPKAGADGQGRKGRRRSPGNAGRDPFVAAE